MINQDIFTKFNQSNAQVNVPKSSNANPAKIVDFTGDASLRAASFVAQDEIYMTWASNQTEADANIADATKRKLFQAYETGNIYRGDGSRDVYARNKQDVDLAPGVEMQYYSEPAGGI